jgi:excisionase family DNA binding protein
VSIATIRRLTEAGDLPHVRVTGRRPRYRAEDVAAFIEARSSTGGVRARRT